MSLHSQRDTSHEESAGLEMKKSTKRGQRKGRPYTPKPKQARIIARHLSGQSDREIAKQEGVSRGTIYRIRSQSENAMLLQSFREMILDIVPDAIKGLAKLVKERDRQAIIETLKGSRVLIDRHEVATVQEPERTYDSAKVAFYEKYGHWPTHEEAVKFDKTIVRKPTVKGELTE
jgi:transposase